MGKKELGQDLEWHIGDPLYEKWAKGQVNLLKKYMDHCEEKHLKEFIRVMDVLDEQRGTNWRSTLTDVVDLYKKYCPHLYSEAPNN